MGRMRTILLNCNSLLALPGPLGHIHGNRTMSRLQLGIVIALVGACIAIPAIIQHQSQTRLRQENNALRQKADQVVRLSAENQSLSNSVTQLRVAQVSANNQFQELIKVRAELNRLKQENQQSNLVAQATPDQLGELAKLRDEVNRLKKENVEIEKLNAEIRQLRSVASSPPTEEKPPSQPAEGEEQALALRVIRTQGAPFAEKLKQSVSAQDEETFQDVFGRFLQVNGVPTNTIVAAVYDERTGRIVVHAPQSTLDQVEKLTSALDQAP